MCVVVDVVVCVLISLRRLEWRSGSLVNVCVESRFVVCICGQVLCPSMGGPASMNVIFGALWPSMTFRAAVFALPLCVTSMCDLTLLMYVLYPKMSLTRIMSLVSLRKSLCGRWVKLSGSMAYFWIVLMLKVLSAKTERAGMLLLMSNARGVAACSALLIVCRYDLDLTSM